jgi:hypothetical protein
MCAHVIMAEGSSDGIAFGPDILGSKAVRADMDDGAVQGTRMREWLLLTAGIERDEAVGLRRLIRCKRA